MNRQILALKYHPTKPPSAVLHLPTRLCSCTPCARDDGVAGERDTWPYSSDLVAAQFTRPEPRRLRDMEHIARAGLSWQNNCRRTFKAKNWRRVEQTRPLYHSQSDTAMAQAIVGVCSCGRWTFWISTLKCFTHRVTIDNNERYQPNPNPNPNPCHRIW